MNRHAIVIDAVRQISEEQNIPVPKVLFTVKGNTAGWANYQDWSVNFNDYHLENHWEDMITDTVKHEMAHLIAWRESKHRGHGIKWQEVMQRLGIPDPKRCHQYTKDTRTHWEFGCGCESTVWVSTTRANRLVSHKAKCYTCGQQYKRVK